MKNILLVLNAAAPNRNMLDFACYLAKLTASGLTGIFLEDVADENISAIRYLRRMSPIAWEDVYQLPVHATKIAAIEKNIEWFRQACAKRGVNFQVHRNRNVPAREVIHESRFADVLILDPETNFKYFYDGLPGEFAKEVLRKSECPVVVAPEEFGSVEEIIFTYNRSSSSVFAMKQFTYLFPQLHQKKVTVLEINETGAWADIDMHNFREWIGHHYEHVEFIAKKDSVKSGLFKYVLSRKNSMLVMGAYGRSQLSQFFRDSKAEHLMAMMKKPMFIAHL